MRCSTGDQCHSELCAPFSSSALVASYPVSFLTFFPLALPLRLKKGCLLLLSLQTCLLRPGRRLLFQQLLCSLVLTWLSSSCPLNFSSRLRVFGRRQRNHPILLPRHQQSRGQMGHYQNLHHLKQAFSFSYSPVPIAFPKNNISYSFNLYLNNSMRT